MKYDSETRNCQSCKHNFVIEPDDFGFYEKMKVPAPHVCPDCRFKMRALFRNETTLYSGRKCDMCGKAIISMYNPKAPYKIYCYKCFYSDKWDATSYAIDYNETQPFLPQFKELMSQVPKITTYISLGAGPNINTEYANMVGGTKNCYLIFNTSPAEDLMYSRGVRWGKDSSDMYFGTTFERCYEGINVQESAGVLWGQNVTGSVDSAFIMNGRGLMNCFGCVNLNNKSHHFLNQPLSQEEYKNRTSEIMGSYEKTQEFKKQFEKLRLSLPMRENNNIKTVNSTGDYLFECKNVRDSFELTNSEDCRYVFSSKEIKDSIGTIGYGTKSERLLECVATGVSSNIIGSYGADESSNIIYGFYVANCSDCLGCDGLRNKKYAILNKVYPKDEYERLKNKITKELEAAGLFGLIMPPELAPFAYNETVAQDNFPMTKEEVVRAGMRWEDDIQKTEGKETLKPEEIPDHIRDVQDTILKEILKCIDCSRNYKITEQELQFYKKTNIPIPRKCFYCRHRDRTLRRGPIKFWDRNCAKCKKDIRTNYAPERPEIVYCEKCYQQTVY